jgi:hypothetical protein
VPANAVRVRGPGELPMKLRLTADSVRLRLNQTDVARLVQSGELSEKVEFPGRVTFVYGLRVSGESEQGTARFADGELIVSLPAASAAAWMNSNKEVGLYYDQKSEGGAVLRLIIEKDYQCIDGPAEEIDPAGYPNPLAKVGHKAPAK